VHIQKRVGCFINSDYAVMVKKEFDRFVKQLPSNQKAASRVRRGLKAFIMPDQNGC